MCLALRKSNRMDLIQQTYSEINPIARNLTHLKTQILQQQT